jgi:phage/plasmid-like protein (TIGR03299 family)
MAHNLNFNEATQKHSFFSVKEKAWHNLGQIITDYPTSAEAIRHAQLDYLVEKRPLFTYDSENQSGESDLIIPEIEVNNFYATVRTDTDQVLGVVGKDYHIVQNIDAFAFFDSIVGGKDGILYETAGALGNGEKIFITAKLPEYIRVGKNDLIEQYLFLTTSHDGYGSITAAFTPVRIVCQNTLNAAMRNKSNCIKIRHTSSATDRLKQAHELLGITNLLAGEMEQLFNQWAKIRITDSEVKKLVQMAMAPNKETLQSLQSNRQDELSSIYNNSVSAVLDYANSHPSQLQAITQGTLYGAYNAVNGYFQNVRNYKDGESKFKSIMYGTALQRNQTAFDLCQSFAKSGVRAFN